MKPADLINTKTRQLAAKAIAERLSSGGATDPESLATVALEAAVGALLATGYRYAARRMPATAEDPWAARDFLIALGDYTSRGTLPAEVPTWDPNTMTKLWPTKEDKSSTEENVR